MFRLRPGQRRFVPFFVLALAASAPLGCQESEPKTALNYAANAKRAYERAMEEFDSHNWMQSQALFREVKRKYTYSRYARLAELRIADAEFQQDKYADAIRGYRTFVHDHRSDDEVSYARAKIAESQYRQISESILLPASEERDQAAVVDAYRELKSFLSDYPEAKESVHIRELLSDVISRLIRHELYVARFYLAKDNYEAASTRIQYALRNFSHGLGSDSPVGAESPLEAEALLLLGETFLQMHKWVEAKSSFSTLVGKYPTSPCVVAAQNYLVYMKARGV